MDGVDDVGIEQHAVAVGEGEDRVEMHGGAQLRHRRDDDPFGCTLANSVAASWLIACRDVRSLMPIRTLPLPIGMTSPPSSVARPQSWVGSPHQTFTLPAKSGWNL